VAVQAVPDLVRALGPVQPVLLYRNSPLSQILSESSELGIGWVQLHGSESLALGHSLSSAGLRLIRALPDTADRQLLLDWLDLAEVLLLDGADPGSGQPRQWHLPSALDPRRTWLAGGLTPTNVAQVLENAAVAGVDAASGLESDGLLDPQKIADFAHAARQAAVIRSQG
jgi:phosphoribosylanthranilate isomerase